jgi:hypothetical protein
MSTANVRFGSLADMRSAKDHVRSKRGHSLWLFINEVVCAQQEISANRQSNADDVTVVEIAATTHANIAPKR